MKKDCSEPVRAILSALINVPSDSDEDPLNKQVHYLDPAKVESILEFLMSFIRDDQLRPYFATDFIDIIKKLFNTRYYACRMSFTIVKGMDKNK